MNVDGRILYGKRVRIPVELRMIRAEGDLDANRQVGRSRVIVLLQSPANFPCLNANYRVVTGRVIGVAVEDFSSDCAFFEEFVAPLQAVAHDVGEELLAPGAAAKWWTIEDLIQLAEYHRLRFIALRW